MPDAQDPFPIARELHSGTFRDARTASVLRWIAIAAAFALLLWLLADVVLLIFLAVLLAVMLRGVSDWLARHVGIPEGWALALVTVTAALLIVGFAYYLGPRLVSQMQDLWSRLSEQINHMRSTYGNTPWGRLVFERLSPSPQLETKIANSAATVATSTIGAVTSVFILVVTALYFAIAPDLYADGLARLFPLERRSRVREILQEIATTLRWWSLGQTIDMITVGVLTGIGLALLGVPLALALGLLAGLLTFVPYFGAIAAAVPAAAVAFTVSLNATLWTLAVFLVAHGVDAYLISPLVQKRTVELPPALTILSMTVLGTVFGTMGIILGTPLAAAGLVAVREAYVHDVVERPRA